MEQGPQQIVDLIWRGLYSPRIAAVWNLGRPHQYLLVPRDDKDRASIHGLSGGAIKVRYGQKTASISIKPGETVHLNDDLAAAK